MSTAKKAAPKAACKKAAAKAPAKKVAAKAPAKKAAPKAACKKAAAPKKAAACKKAAPKAPAKKAAPKKKAAPAKKPAKPAPTKKAEVKSGNKKVASAEHKKKATAKVSKKSAQNKKAAVKTSVSKKPAPGKGGKKPIVAKRESRKDTPKVKKESSSTPKTLAPPGRDNAASVQHHRMRMRHRAKEEIRAPEEKRRFTKPAYPAKIMKELRQLLVDERDRMIHELRLLETRVYDDDNTIYKPGFTAQSADAASDDMELEMALKMRSLEAQRYTLIIEALKAMETNAYGYCQGTGKPIELERLLFEPWTKFSIAYLNQRAEEAKKKRH